MRYGFLREMGFGGGKVVGHILKHLIRHVNLEIRS